MAEYIYRLSRAPERGRFIRESWFDLTITAVSTVCRWQSMRVLRAIAAAVIGLRHLRVALARRRFHWVLAVTVVIVLVGAAGEFYFEGRGDGSIKSFPDSVWLAIVTATTVGYGDLSPVTPEGRLIAVLLMLTGIGVIGIFTANVASLFFEQDARSEPRGRGAPERDRDVVLWAAHALTTCA